MQDQGLDCGKCVKVCTEGAASIVICYSDATAKIKKSSKQKSAVYTLHNTP